MIKARESKKYKSYRATYSSYIFLNKLIYVIKYYFILCSVGVWYKVVNNNHEKILDNAKFLYKKAIELG